MLRELVQPRHRRLSLDCDQTGGLGIVELGILTGVVIVTAREGAANLGNRDVKPNRPGIGNFIFAANLCPHRDHAFVEVGAGYLEGADKVVVLDGLTDVAFEYLEVERAWAAGP